MGLLSSLKATVSDATSASLPHNVGPLGISPAHTQHASEHIYRLTENKVSWTGDDFNIKDAHGKTAFKCRAKKITLHERREFTDANGQPIYVLLKRIIAIHKTYDAVSPTDEKIKLFTIKKHLSFGKANLSVTFKNLAGDGREVELRLRGELMDYFDRKAEITTTDGVPVARISRSFGNARELFFDKQTYLLSVAAGVDASLLVALCTILDETENDKNV